MVKQQQVLHTDAYTPDLRYISAPAPLPEAIHTVLASVADSKLTTVLVRLLQAQVGPGIS